jgi:glutamine amidotransferase/cyclase
MTSLQTKGFIEPLKNYIQKGGKFFGICVGMQCLFESSEEFTETPGLGIIPGKVSRFNSATKSVPHMGWNYTEVKSDPEFSQYYYFVHSFAVQNTEASKDWVFSTTTYEDETFISSVRKGNLLATQFHPEKSGTAGLQLINWFLTGSTNPSLSNNSTVQKPLGNPLTKRIIACLDVRTNDQGDLVVTKGDQYDVREKEGDNEVRNLGKPVELATRYFLEGADEVTFLNITSFRNSPLKDLPMLQILELASKQVFIPLTIGGGIRETVDPDGTVHSASEVAGTYFRSGADKVSIGGDAVIAAENYYKNGGKLDGSSAIESISKVYGNQAVVISVDPRRVYVKDPSETTHATVKAIKPDADGREYCWYQCSIKGGREFRDLDVVQLVKACEALGAGEILLNCIDQDGTNSGYDTALISQVKQAVSIPVIASSGAGKVEHFSEVFDKTNVDAALAAGIFHREEVPIQSVKNHLIQEGLSIRPV